MRESTTRYVILGVLDVAGPMSGYEVQSWIGESISFFWNESFGQIYPELRLLAKDGLIAPVREKKPGDRPRQRFRITAEGKRALREWLAKPAQPERIRVEFLLKLFFGRESNDETNRSHIAAVEQRHRGLLEQFAGVEAALIGEAGELPDLAWWLVVLRQGQLVSRARVQWAEDARRLLDAHARGGNRALVAMYRRLAKE